MNFVLRSSKHQTMQIINHNNEIIFVKLKSLFNCILIISMNIHIHIK